MVTMAAAVAEVDRYSDAVLDAARLRGDPPADRVIQALFEDREVTEARRLLGTLIQNDQPPPDGLPPEVLEYLSSAPAIPEGGAGGVLAS